MKEGAVSTHLHLVHTKRDVQPKKNAERQDTAVSPWMDQVAHGEQLSVGRRGTRFTASEQESREARIEALRARVQGGTYRVDSVALAESILKNDSHFVGATL